MSLRYVLRNNLVSQRGPAVAAARLPSARLMSCSARPLQTMKPASVGCSSSVLPSTQLHSAAVCASRRSLHMTVPCYTPADVPADLAADIADIIRHDRVVLFLTGTPEQPECRFTKQIVELMDQIGLKYGYFNIAADDEVCEGLKAYSDWPTYPQMYIDGELLGGYDICKEMMLDGSLTKMLSEKKLL